MGARGEEAESERASLMSRVGVDAGELNLVAALESYVSTKSVNKVVDQKERD